jgi:hypothetical protein
VIAPMEGCRRKVREAMTAGQLEHDAMIPRCARGGWQNHDTVNTYNRTL